MLEGNDKSRLAYTQLIMSWRFSTIVSKLTLMIPIISKLLLLVPKSRSARASVPFVGHLEQQNEGGSS